MFINRRSLVWSCNYLSRRIQHRRVTNRATTPICHRLSAGAVISASVHRCRAGTPYFESYVARLIVRFLIRVTTADCQGTSKSTYCDETFCCCLSFLSFSSPPLRQNNLLFHFSLAIISIMKRGRIEAVRPTWSPLATPGSKAVVRLVGVIEWKDARHTSCKPAQTSSAMGIVATSERAAGNIQAALCSRVRRHHLRWFGAVVTRPPLA